MTKENELLPCPFCGGEAESIDAFHPDVEVTWLVHCKVCEASTTTDERENTERDAIKAWNTRHSDKLQAENERLREALQNIMKHQKSLTTGNIPMYKMSGAWQIAKKALEGNR